MERPVYLRMYGIYALIFILSGFLLILLSVLLNDGILLITAGTIPGIILICIGVYIYLKLLKVLKYYNMYLSGITSLQEMSDILMTSKISIKDNMKSLMVSNFMVSGYFTDDDKVIFEDKIIDAEKSNIKTAVKDEVVESNNVKQEVIPSGINDWKSYIEYIKNAENEYKTEDISYSLYKMSKVLEKIFDFLSNHKDKEQDVSRLMDSYIPLVLKLIDSYRELANSGIHSFSVNRTKEDIISACDKINEALQGALQDLYDGTALDISADTSVLQMMLARDGFLNRDIFKNKK